MTAKKKAQAKRKTTRRQTARVKRILVPVDFSDKSSEAIAYAAGIAGSYGATMELLHVVEPFVHVEDLVLPSSVALLNQQHVENATKRLEKLASKLVPQGVKHTVKVELGDIDEQILRESAEYNTDLLILNTHGYTGIKELFMGGTAEKLVRYAKCPVLVVRRRSRRRPSAERMKRILVPLDFSDHSKKALQYAKHFAKHFGASIDLVSSVEPMIYYEGMTVSTTMTEDTESIGTEAGVALRRLGEKEIPKGVDWGAFVRMGSAHHEVIETAKDRKTDLLVITTHGHTGLKHFLLGSTAEQIVRHAPCPVLVVRDKEHDFV